MTDSFITGNEPDKKLQTYENTIGGEQVHSEAVTPTDTAGDPFTDTNRFPVGVGEGAITAKAVTATASGTTTLHTPSAGNAIRLWWYNMGCNPDAGASVVVGLRWTTGGTDFFSTKLSQYGGQISHSFKAGRSYVQGGVDEALVANLDSAQTVYFNFDYEEI